MGGKWNRIKTAAEWTPDSGLSAEEVLSGEKFYSGSRQAQYGTATPQIDYAEQSLIAWDDLYTGDYSSEESDWVATVSDQVYLDTRTGLYWHNPGISAYNCFDNSTCDFFSTEPRGDYDGSDIGTCTGGGTECGPAGNAINYCATLSLDSDGDSTLETDWYLPSVKELFQAQIDGIANHFALTPGSYWSSTEASPSPNSVWTPYMPYPTGSNSGKEFNRPFLCVRRD
ncbi:DUF1566 domain-containing protein [Candidatus Dojkabacteria bacterium]|nr:DUF1566 domain-containing protein [Candidatus Dojkabacteria bacterium]